ncbi:MAG: LacI family transcriptional regulator [Bacteroidetes bacterium]|nr:LacI family transcriptional regulator [Bacteroidota bacterium]
MKHSTIIDIAKKLGISPSTVSRALSDHPDVKRETKERVRKVAEELNYTPNPIARSLKSSKTTTIGVIVPEIRHDFFSSAISGIEEVAYRSGYTIILSQTNESYEREVVNVNVLLHHRVAGMIVSISQNTKSGDHFLNVIRRKIPIVFFDRAFEGIPVSKVVVDDYKGAFDAVSYLLSKGYKRIAHIGGPKDLGICQRRKNGYIDALKHHNMIVDETLIYSVGMRESDGYAAMEAMLHSSHKPDAVFCVNDPVAVGAFQKIKEAGLHIPRDCAVVGFSNNKITGLLDPPLTTVEQPSFDLGKNAAEILIRVIEDKVEEPIVKVLGTKLIVRGST